MTFTPAEADYKQMVTEKIGGNHFTNHIGFHINKIEPGLIEGILRPEEHHMQQMNFVHGGVTATIADIVMGFAAFTLVKKGNGVVTVELKTSYLNPGQGDEIFAKGYVIKAGRRLFFCEAELYIRNAGKELLMAKASATMAVVTPEDLSR